MLSYIFSFAIEMIRFYKIILRLLALAAPIWYYQRITIKMVLLVCGITTILSLACTSIVVLHRSNFEVYGGKISQVIFIVFILFYDAVILDPFHDAVIASNCNMEILTIYSFYITYSLDCLPEYIVIDELFPLGFIVLLLDVLVIYLMRKRLKKINSKDERKRERRMTIFVISLFFALWCYLNF
jgi:hypothetical protein